MKNKRTAWLLALFVGTFGAHWFYLGKPLRGLLYLIFSWTILATIFALYDFIVLFTMDAHHFDRKYNKY